jgi:drug/metabolite transporter (DMT)-like permease
LALAGLVILMLPGVSAPSMGAALLMVIAGVAWGVYSIRGRSSGDPTRVTGDNFIYAAPIALVVSVVFRFPGELPFDGIFYAVMSGAVTSGIGYSIWYTALPQLSGTTAATVQLSVPVITAFLGVIFLGESLTQRLAVATAAIIGGIWLTIRRQTDK